MVGYFGKKKGRGASKGEGEAKYTKYCGFDKLSSYFRQSAVGNTKWNENIGLGHTPVVGAY